MAAQKLTPSSTGPARVSRFNKRAPAANPPRASADKMVAGRLEELTGRMRGEARRLGNSRTVYPQPISADGQLANATRRMNENYPDKAPGNKNPGQ